MNDVLTREGPETPSTPEELRLGNLWLHSASYRATVDGEQVTLTAREFDLVHILSLHPDEIVPFETLAVKVLGSGDRQAIRHLNVLVHRVRAKLAALKPYELQTVRFRGYGLLGPFSNRTVDAG